MLPDADAARIDRYRETIGRAWRQGDTNVWPVKLNAAMHLFVKEFGEELIDDLSWLEARGRSLEEIARPFGNPARLYRIIDSTIYSMRRNRYPVAAQRAVVVKLLTMTRALKYGSEFNEDGRNLIYRPEQAGEHALRLRARPRCSLAESRLVHRFCAMMWAYTESIFFRAHDVTKEIHGPYRDETDGSQFIVKEYYHLRPADLWPNTPLLPCHTIRVWKRYAHTVRLRIDALNHLYHDGGELVPGLDACAVEVDGEWRDTDVLERLLVTVQQTVQSISRQVDAMSWHDRVQRYAEIFWFRKKPLSDARGRDWRPPAPVRRAIAGGFENVRRRTPLSDEASERLAMLTI